MIPVVVLLASLTFGQSARPVYTPEVPVVYHLLECPFCHDVYDSECDAEGDYVFIKHRIVKFDVTDFVAAYTCEKMYARYIEAMASLMVHDGVAEVKTVLRPVKHP